MRGFLSRLLALVLAVFASLPAAATGSPWVSAFYVGWSASSYPPSAVDYASLSHVMMFSVLPHGDGSLDTGFFGAGPGVAVDLAQRAHAAGRKAVLVVGGSATQVAFQGATSAANIDRFVQNLAAAVRQYGYDGVDLDWEPITQADFAPMLALVAKLRAALPAGSVITADVAWLNANFGFDAAEAAFYAQLGAAVDQLNIMSYGMADNWGGWLSWHSSALQAAAPNTPSSVESSVNGYLAAGVPAAKLGMGIGFYGSCWSAPVSAPRQQPGPSSVVAGDNELGYATLMAQYHSAAAYHYDATAQAPYLSFATPKGPYGCTFISYEDATSIAAKGQYARQRGLGGTIIWQINEAYQAGSAQPNALLAAVGAAFLGGGAPAASTSTTLAATPTAAVFGQSVGLQATVTSSAGTPTGTGTVAFREGSATLGSAALANGVAALSLGNLGVGSHGLAAAFGGSAGYAPSQSTTVTVTISAAATSTALSSSRNPSRLASPPSFTVRVRAVAPGAGVVKGQVSFYDGSTALATVSLSNGAASWRPAALARGSHAISASYLGSAQHKASRSATLTQVVR